MPKRIVILDPNGVEIDSRTNHVGGSSELAGWAELVNDSCFKLAKALKAENPKLGTYTVTVQETE